MPSTKPVNASRRLSTTTQVGLWGSIASLVGLALFFANPATPTNHQVSGDGINNISASNSTVIINAAAKTEFESKRLKPLPEHFVAVRIATPDTTWTDETGDLPFYRENSHSHENPDRGRHLYVPFIDRAELLFFSMFSEEEPVFEVTFVNQIQEDITITDVGIRLIDGKSHRYTTGDSSPTPVPIAARIEIPIPNHVTSEEIPFGFPSDHFKALEQPLFLTPGTPFRYTFRPVGFLECIPSAVLVAFALKTSHGVIHSRPIYIAR